jgi:Na+/H+ antiporter NhaD/arsenite permease-like protein
MEFGLILTYSLIIIAFAGIAIGKLPRLAMDRTSIAVATAVLLVLAGGISFQAAFSAIDTETIVLLFSMMVLVANLRLSGFFDLAGSAVLRHARTPKTLLAMVVIASGFLSALFLNDTICIMLTPLVAEIARRAKRDGRPYLIALAVAANAGSCMTSIGNPQNMLIASRSGLGFLDFLLFLGPPSILAMALAFFASVLAFPGEFASPCEELPTFVPTVRAAEIDLPLMRKTLFLAATLLVLLGAGMRTSVAAAAIAAFLLLTRRTKPEKVFGEVDFTLLAFFSGLFVLTATVARTPVFEGFMNFLKPLLTRPEGLFAASVTLVSNLVSNVPAVMLLTPVAQSFGDARGAWLMLAMASTFAGNLTLLGSVANLIVAEQGRRSGIKIGFLDYLKVGLPVTLLSVAGGTVWLTFVLRLGGLR